LALESTFNERAVISINPWISAVVFLRFAPRPPWFPRLVLASKLRVCGVQSRADGGALWQKYANLAVGVLGGGPVGQSGGAVSPVADRGRPSLRRGGRLLGFPPRRSVLAPLWGSPAQNVHV